MNNINLVIQTVVFMMNTRLTFAPFSFTIMQMFISLAALTIIISFIRKIFD